MEERKRWQIALIVLSLSLSLSSLLFYFLNFSFLSTLFLRISSSFSLFCEKFSVYFPFSSFFDFSNFSILFYFFYRLFFSIISKKKKNIINNYWFCSMMNNKLIQYCYICVIKNKFSRILDCSFSCFDLHLMIEETKWYTTKWIYDEFSLIGIFFTRFIQSFNIYTLNFPINFDAFFLGMIISVALHAFLALIIRVLRRVISVNLDNP